MNNEPIVIKIHMCMCYLGVSKQQPETLPPTISIRYTYTPTTNYIIAPYIDTNEENRLWHDKN